MALTVTPSASSSALAGIRAASQRLDSAAASVVSSTVPQSDTVSISGAARAAAQGGGGEAGGIASAMVDLRIARYQSAASVAVLHTADDATADLLRIADRGRT
jgi:hypothetical protein